MTPFTSIKSRRVPATRELSPSTGADPSIPNFEEYLPLQLIEDHDKEFLELFRRE